MHHEKSVVRALVVAALAAAVVIPACGGGGGGGGGGGVPPTPFTVISTTPVGATAGISKTRTIHIRMSGTIDGATISGVVLRQGVTPVAVTRNHQSCLNTILLDPTAPLAPLTAYTVDVTAALLSSGGTPATPFTFSFTTSAASNTVLPTFLGVSTAANPTTTTVDLTWGAASDDLTVAGSIFYDIFVSTLGNTCFDFGAAPVASPQGVTSHTVTGLNPNTTYFFGVRARDAEGNRDATGDNTAAPAGVKTLVSFLTNLYTPIISVICTTCHFPGGEGEHMNLTTKALALAAWINVPPGDGVGTISMCDVPPPGVNFRVEPGNADNSLLFRKVAPDNAALPRCGERMPLRGFPDGSNIYLDAATVQTFRDWILQGALDN